MEKQLAKMGILRSRSKIKKEYSFSHNGITIWVEFNKGEKPTIKDIIWAIFDRGYQQGKESGSQEKINEIMKVLNIKPQ